MQMTRDIWITINTDSGPTEVKLCFWQVGDKWVCMADSEYLDDLESIIETGRPVGYKSPPKLTLVKQEDEPI
jgi:hypothetical protein